MTKKKTPITCDNCGHKWQTVKQWDCYCRKCGVKNTVKPAAEIVKMIQDANKKERYQMIIFHLSDGRTIKATVPEFCKEGDTLLLLPQFEVTEPKELPSGTRWGGIDE